MDSVSRFLYTSDHREFLTLTEETWLNRWFPHQINLREDVYGLRKLGTVDLEFYKFLFTFLGMAEELVNFNITGLVADFENHDLSHYYVEQMAMENIHSKVYANILNMFFNNNTGEVQRYARQILDDEFLARKIHWLHRRVGAAQTRAEKVILFYLIEGIFFISSFYSIGLLRVRGLMNGVCQANDYISRDEQLHTRAAGLLFNSLLSPQEKPSAAWIKSIFSEAVQVEYDFIKSKSMGVTLVDVEEIRCFLEATADRLLKMIGLDALFGTTPPENCPLVYVGSIKSVNFFERENTDYTGSVENDL